MKKVEKTKPIFENSVLPLVSKNYIPCRDNLSSCVWEGSKTWSMCDKLASIEHLFLNI